MFWKSIYNRTIVIGFLLLLGLGIAFYLIPIKGAEKSITQQVLERELVVARAEKSNIVNFFESIGSSISVLAQSPSIRRRDNTTIEKLDVFVDEWGSTGVIGGVILTDKDGVVTFNSNILGTSDVGESIADRDYFLWAKDQTTEGRYFVGEPVIGRLGASKDQFITVVASPVFLDGKFGGIAAASVKLEPLAKKYLTLMKVSDDSKVYLFTSRGEFLYGEPDNVILNAVKDKLYDSEGGFVATKTYKIAYSPVLLGTQNWMVVVAIPINEINKNIIPIYMRLSILFLLVCLTFVIFGVTTNREFKKDRGSNHI